MKKMRKYQVAITITDSTEVDAYSEEEAYEIAQTVFQEAGYYQINSNAELDIIGIEDFSDEELQELADEQA